MNIIDFSQQIKDNLESVGEFLKKELGKELEAQGHKATGSLINSIEYAVNFYKDGLILAISYNDYGAVVNNGVKASRIPYGKDSNGGTSQYIQGLLNWVLKVKTLTTEKNKALGIAFAIAKTHAKMGIPTLNSFKYSKNGRRLGFQDYVLAQKSDEIIELMQKNLDAPVWAALDDYLTKNITG